MTSARLLVVEDDPIIGDELVQALAVQGYEVALALEGRLAMAEAEAAAPDLVLLDLGLPDVDGVTVCRRLRAVLPSAVIVVLTARTQERAGRHAGQSAGPPVGRAAARAAGHRWIAHELRTPLSQVRLETEVALRRDRPAPELRAALTEVLGATDRMTNALDTSLGLAQHNIRPSDGTTPAGQVARDALASVGDRAGGLRMTLDLDSDDFLVGCDHDVVLRMVQPLL